MSTKPKLLIVDDKPENIRVLMETLKSDFAIVAATSGDKALELARTPPVPELILLDVVMPGMSGYEVCELLKSDVRTQHVPIIFVTSLSEEEDEAHGLALGAADYITKPFRPSIVSARVRNHLELKRHQDGLQALVEEQIEEIEEAHTATIFAMSKLAESRDDDTGKHLERTQEYCRQLAAQMLKRGLHPDIVDEDFVETIFHASPLHDVGKVAIPDAILCKPGKLTEEEFAIMRTHTLRGSETLFMVAKSFPSNRFINMGLDIARWHHEKWNGTGYPEGLAGTAIPLAARIMAVSDVYDALTSKRCYKPAFPHDKSRDIIVGDRGTHFDPDLVDIFLDLEGVFKEISALVQ